MKVDWLDKSLSAEERGQLEMEAGYAALDPGCDRSARSIWRSRFIESLS